MIPGLKAIFDADPIKTGAGFAIKEPTLGGVISAFLNLALMVGGFLMLFWFAWGVFQYIFAGGSKEGLSYARKRIIWSIVGFVILILAFAISQFLKEDLAKPKDIPITTVTTP